jgi:hypothetical protein
VVSIHRAAGGAGQHHERLLHLREGRGLGLDRQRTDLVALAREVAAAQQAATQLHEIVVKAAVP